MSAQARAFRRAERLIAERYRNGALTAMSPGAIENVAPQVQRAPIQSGQWDGARIIADAVRESLAALGEADRGA